jgi:3-methylfumaryl-CoA hydratase
LVVHGPLQATWLVLHLLDHTPAGARIARFAFRGRRPALDGRPLTLVGGLDDSGGGAARLETRDHTGAICMQAEAVLA